MYRASSPHRHDRTGERGFAFVELVIVVEIGVVRGAPTFLEARPEE
jgi:hypothetical protein